ncbi:MAG: 50S ribosomal protein L9 [Mycoplasmoidaceae bacterium]|nr:50S ribosomal protein L9 [Mycoplasmoidaceae bacterium]
MRVILKKDIKGLGRINQIVTVKDGYAKNFLFKNNLAVMVNDKSLNDLNKTLTKQAEFEAEQVKKFTEIKNKIEKINLEFTLKTNKDKTFGAISVTQIIDELKSKHQITIDKFMINNQDKKFDLGVHIIQIELYKSIVAKLNINVKPEK